MTEVNSAVRSGALSVAAVGKICLAGTGCHSCHPAICDRIDSEVARRTEEVRRSQDDQLDIFCAESLLDTEGRANDNDANGAHRSKHNRRGS